MINVYDFLQSQGEEFKKLSFKDTLFVHYRCPQEERYTSLYTHLHYFLYVLSGKKMFHQPGGSVPLNEGACAFVRKGGFLQERFFDVDWQLMAFFVPDGFLRDIVAEYRGSLPAHPQPLTDEGQVIQLHVTELSKAFFHSMVPYFFEPGGVPEQLVEIKFREMVFHLLSDPQNQPLLAYLSQLDEKHLALRNVMEANYRHNLSLEEFARITNRSLSAFKRDFLALHGIPPGKWLLKRRLDCAERLLVTTDKPISHIADESGFESQTHFNRVFKVRFGTTPLHYRVAKRLALEEEPRR